jgi:hypothetical protein
MIYAAAGRSKVIEFGYRHSTCQITPAGTRVYHLELKDKPTTSIGEVKRIYPMRRDSAMLSFPCYEVTPALIKV